MARIPEAEIERLKNEMPVERLVEGAGIELKKTGKDLLGRCPFHDDQEPSLVVTPSKNLWHCFGCQTGGGPIDWVMTMNGISFRHAVLLLREGSPALASGKPVKQTTVRTLHAPVAPDADDQALMNQVIGYYHETCKQSPEALAYLKRRGLDHPELVDKFKLRFANRTLGLRLPEKTRVAGAGIRARLQTLGLLRDSGHEHFNGSLVVPVFDAAGNVAEVYGRKITEGLRPGTPSHLYLPGPHRGVWNGEALKTSKEIILTEALIDAMTFWCAGYRHVTASYGVAGFTDDHLAAFKRFGTERVLIAYDRDDAGEQAAMKLAEKLMAEGLERWRIQFPKGMDANEYAVKVLPATKSLGIAIWKSVWLGKGKPKSEMATLPEVAFRGHREAIPATMPVDIAAQAMPAREVQPASPVPPASVPDTPAEVRENEVVLTFGDRRYRVRGLAKNLSYEVMKVNLLAACGEAFFVDTLDLYSARARASYLTQAAVELQVREDILKTDIGRVLLKLEALQDERIKAALTPKPGATQAMLDAEREAALALLRSPNLLDRVLLDFEAIGIVGERTNKLVGYLAAVSRLLDHPLAVVIQSSSAAGKSSLMDAMLSLMPEEERVKYSAMTGQSLFYLGETNLKHKVLAIVEEEGAARASYALKLLQSEGELTIASTGKDPATGNLVTQANRVEGPVAIFLTTTAIEIDEELMNRCLVLSVDENRAQTQAIHRRQREKRTLAGRLAKQDKEAVLTLHRNAQRLIRPLAVVNPYASELTFPDGTTRLRRDHEKYLTLIDTIALLHQYQRPVKIVTRQGQAIEYIEVTLDDIGEANALAHEVLGRSLDELPPQTRRLLHLIEGMVEDMATSREMHKSDYRFSRRALRDYVSWGDTQLKVHLARLTEMEYLIAHRDGRGGFAYELVYDGQGKAGQPFLAGLIDIGSLKIYGYDAKRSGENNEPSGAGRPPVGGPSAAGRESETAGEPIGTDLSGQSPTASSKNPIAKTNGKSSSYPQALPLAAAHA